ncbi:hypothetical protein FOA52_008365 [Chlamydomonas sp. UWO 241]|nr:hypothetical protein FOA52_008365 [Chlamydomonas sp. UWO 241]
MTFVGTLRTRGCACAPPRAPPAFARSHRVAVCRAAHGSASSSRVGTSVVHSGERGGRPSVRDSLTTPIVQTSTYWFKDTAELIAYNEGRFESYEYGRYGNPTVQTVEAKIRELEGAEDALCSASGMNSVTSMLLALVPAGGHIITTSDCYWRTRQFMINFLPKMNIGVSVIAPNDMEALQRELDAHDAALFFSESPTNPYLRCVDIPEIVKLCHAKGTTVCIDSTFATPINSRDLTKGVFYMWLGLWMAMTHCHMAGVAYYWVQDQNQPWLTSFSDIMSFNKCKDIKACLTLPLPLVEGKIRDNQTKYWKEHGATTACTLRLCKPWNGKGSIVSGDSWFGSMNTARALRARGLFCVTSVKTGTKGFPEEELQELVGGDALRGTTADGKKLQLNYEMELPHLNHFRTTFNAVDQSDRPALGPHSVVVVWQTKNVDHHIFAGSLAISEPNAHNAIVRFHTSFSGSQFASALMELSIFVYTAIKLGADLVLHSGTKYLAGHNDVLAGALAGRKYLVQTVRKFHHIMGGVIDPNAAYLLLRGMKTLKLRVEHQNAAGMEIAQRLEAHPKIDRVWYPGLVSHPDHAIAKRQMSGFGGVVSFEVTGDLWNCANFIDHVRIPYIGPSLGGVESLIEMPAVQSYWGFGPDKRAEIGIKENLIRFAIGVEDVEDIWEDLVQALEYAK